jgi:hypothetical protein
VRFKGKLYRRKLGTDDLEFAGRKLREFKDDSKKKSHTISHTKTLILCAFISVTYGVVSCAMSN